LTGTADFSSFVKPRLAVGPDGDHNPERPDAPQLPQFPGQVNRNTYGAATPAFVNASYVSRSGFRVDAAGEEFRPSFARELKLAPKQVIEVEIPVAAGAANFGVTFMADALVSATLADDKGATRGQNLAASPEARGFFRTIFVDKNVTAGAWKLRLENTGTLDTTAVIAAWHDAAAKKF
jgi:hypothetical protein